MDRDLFVTADMLRAEGLNVDVRVFAGTVMISLDNHTAAFRSSDLCAAADWLCQCVFVNYPQSDFAKLWLLIAKAVVTGKIATK